MDYDVKKIILEIDRLHKKLETVSPGTESYSNVSNELSRLYKIKNEILNERNKRDDNKREFVTKVINIGVGASLSILTLVTYWKGYNRGLAFEQDGTILSDTVKRHNRMLSLKL